LDQAAIRRKLGAWYDRTHRDLPWRRTSDPYSIWISEIMLQQTRVAAVIPYYQHFLARFPRVQDLAAASEDDVLALWSGLGYYTRARNLLKAARQIVAAGGFPRDYASIRALAGVGDYTAAAVASIAFGLPHAAMDGNVRRVITRLTGDGDADVGALAAQLLDTRRPGRWNQAVMELGATICLPGEPLCAECPVMKNCEAHRRGIQAELPLPRKRPEILRKERIFLMIRRKGRILLVPSPRVSGFWDLPEVFSGVRLGLRLGEFRHSITNSQYHCEVREAKIQAPPRNARWWDENKLDEILLSTAAKKALRCLQK
jgi:A/G-specific adenine glycosylase